MNNSKQKNKGRNNPPSQAAKKRQTPSTHSTPSTKKHRWHHIPKPYRSRKPVKSISKQQHSATQSVTAATVVNLSKTPISADTHSILSLGPVFRPTPAPADDETVQKSVRQFSKSIRTSAFFALNPPDEERAHNPKLYHPTGVAVDPESPALDSTLMKYEATISRALKHTQTVQYSGNLTHTERATLKRLSENGTGDHVFLCADKDTSFVAVTHRQHETMWHSHTSTDAYQETDFFQVKWESFRREVVRLAKFALKSELITASEYRFVTKDCTGSIRHPVGNLLVKTHKLINLYAVHPVPVCPTRVILTQSTT